MHQYFNLFPGSENEQPSEMQCGKASVVFLECFKNSSDMMMDVWQTNTAPYTIEDIKSRCL